MNMNEIIESGKNMIGGADGPTSIFIAGKTGPEIYIITIVIGLLFCFFGLKLAKLLVVLNGFLLGLVAGIGAAAAVHTEGMVFIVIMLVCGVVAAALTLFFYKFGVFCLVFTGTLAPAAAITGLTETAFGTVSLSFGIGSREMIIGIAAIVVSLILAAAAVRFVEPMIIVITALDGGMSAGLLFIPVIGLAAPGWTGYAVGVLLVIIGMIVQFMMHSRKIGRKEKSYAEEIKEKDSVESEVEKARNVLVDEEEEE